MSHDSLREVESLYHAARARPAADRAAFLAEACADDALRREVASLLAADVAESPLKTAGAWSRAPLIGQRLGAYEIVGLLGAGGMGEVYRARDTTLKRDVAIKVLPAEFANDRDRLARFTREAQVLAALNHPNIAQIYGIEESNVPGPGSSVRALVMELVEGDDLSAHIARGPMPVTDALPIARQIADALEAAHELGIVHRDLKPANIKVRADGTVKVLDFGLARTLDPGPGTRDTEHSPTGTSPAMTERGIILGTAAYMPPEQARGSQVDTRADIWAFGVIVFEMLTGTRLFAGDTVSDTLASVLREEIPWHALTPATPPALRRVLERCLQKDPRRRLRDIGDARSDIEEAIAWKDLVTLPTTAVVAVRPVRRLLWIVAVAAMAALVTLSVWALTRPGAMPADIWQFTQITDTAGEETTPAISPDGTTIMFASRARGTWDIYSQRVGGRNRTLVIGEPDRQELGPTFSPDGQQIAFYEGDDDGGIFVAGATGESVRRLSDFGFHPSWSPDERRLAFTTEQVISPYISQGTSKLWVIDLTTGGSAPRQLDPEDARQPSWSPSGHRIVFWSQLGGQRDLFTIPSDGGARVPLLADAPIDWAPVWEPDGKHVLFSSDRGGSMNLWRIAVDEGTGRALGSPEPVTAGVQAASELASVSKDGSRIVFQSRVRSVNPVAIPFDPTTLQAGTPAVLDSSNHVLIPSDVSRDGRSLLLFNSGGLQEDIFKTSTDHFAPVRITDDAFGDRRPMWMPDGRSLLFYSTRGGKWEIWRINEDGGSLHKVVSLFAINPLVSPTGDRIAFNATLDWGVFVEPLSGSVVSTAQALPATKTATASLHVTSWSPDGGALTGTLVPASGRGAGVAIYDLAGGAMRQVSADSSEWVRWMPDSRRLIYFTARGELVVADTQSGTRTVVNVRLPLPPIDNTFALSPDGRMIYYGGTRAESDIWVIERKKR